MAVCSQSTMPCRCAEVYGVHLGNPLLLRDIDIGHVVAERPVGHAPYLALVFDDIFDDKRGFIADIIAGIAVGVTGIPCFDSNAVLIVAITAQQQSRAAEHMTDNILVRLTPVDYGQGQLK